MSLGNWHGGRHRWEAPIGRSSQSFPWERSPSDGTSSYAPRARSHRQLRYQGANQKEIARAVARCPSTISRELRRNSTAGEYYSTQAQWKAAQRRRERPLARKMDDPAVNEAVRRGLAQEWAPQQIAGRMQQQARPRRVVANDLHLDQAGRESGALGIVPAASREASLPAEKRRHQRRCRPHPSAPK